MQNIKRVEEMCRRNPERYIRFCCKIKFVQNLGPLGYENLLHFGDLKLVKIEYPARFIDIKAPDFFLWVNLKGKEYNPNLLVAGQHPC